MNSGLAQIGDWAAGYQVHYQNGVESYIVIPHLRAKRLDHLDVQKL